MSKKMRVGPAAVLAFALGAAVAGGGTATAARLITGKDIKNGSIGVKDLSKPVRAKLKRTGTTGPSGPTGDQGPKGEPGPPGLSLFTFADTAVSGGITLSGTDQVVATTEGQLPSASGAIGGPVTLPGGSKYATTATIRVRTSGTGAYNCALQSKGTTSWFELDRTESTSVASLRFVVPEGGYTNAAPSTRQYRVVCTGAATRSVTDTDLNVIGAAQAV